MGQHHPSVLLLDSTSHFKALSFDLKDRWKKFWAPEPLWSLPHKNKVHLFPGLKLFNMYLVCKFYIYLLDIILKNLVARIQKNPQRPERWSGLCKYNTGLPVRVISKVLQKLQRIQQDILFLAFQSRNIRTVTETLLFSWNQLFGNSTTTYKPVSWWRLNFTA